MSAAKDLILAALREQAEKGLNTIEDAALRERMRRQAEPAIWYSYHRQMLASLPSWRLIARAWHKRQLRHYQALQSMEAISAYATIRERAKGADRG